MENALRNPPTGTTFLNFFGLAWQPFASLPEPVSIYHAEQYSLLMNQLAAAAAETDHLVVLRGAGGSGKTTLLNRFLCSLGEDTTYASLDEHCADAVAFHCSILEQIGFGSIDGKLGELQTITRQFLVNRAAAGDTVLLVIDNTHLIPPAVFDQLRWLAAIDHGGRGVLSVILAGSPELRNALDAPPLSGLAFRERADFHIRAYTGEETAEYIDYRLSLAGGDGKVSITPEAHALLYRFTGGLPRLINRVCISVLNEACRRRVAKIDDVLVRAVAEADQLPVNVHPFKGRGRRRTDPDYSGPRDVPDSRMRIRARQVGAVGERKMRVAAKREPDVDVARLFDQIAGLSAELGNLKAERAATQDELRGLKQELSDEKRHARAARGRATRAKSRVQKLEETGAALERATRELRADLDEATRRVRELSGAEEQLAASEAAREAMQSELADLEELRKTIEDRDAHIAALKSQLAGLTAGDTQTQPRLAEMPEPAPTRMTDDGEASDDIVAIEFMRAGCIEQVYEIGEPDGRIMVGRSEDSDLRLESEFVSRHHALIFWTPGHAYIEDLNSFNGTIVNGKGVTRCRIRPDDTIIVGDFRIRPLAAQ